MTWLITYYNEKIQEAILELPDTLLARYIRMSELIEEIGPNIGMPHTKAFKDGLFELRLKGREGIGRVFYCTLANKRIVILHSLVKKTQKTPKKDLDIVRARMKEVKKNG